MTTTKGQEILKAQYGYFPLLFQKKKTLATCSPYPNDKPGQTEKPHLFRVTATLAQLTRRCVTVP